MTPQVLTTVASAARRPSESHSKATTSTSSPGPAIRLRDTSPPQESDFKVPGFAPATHPRNGFVRKLLSSRMPPFANQASRSDERDFLSAHFPHRPSPRT